MAPHTLKTLLPTIEGFLGQLAHDGVLGEYVIVLRHNGRDLVTVPLDGHLPDLPTRLVFEATAFGDDEVTVIGTLATHAGTRRRVSLTAELAEVKAAKEAAAKEEERLCGELALLEEALQEGAPKAAAIVPPLAAGAPKPLAPKAAAIVPPLAAGAPKPLAPKPAAIVPPLAAGAPNPFAAGAPNPFAAGAPKPLAAEAPAAIVPPLAKKARMETLVRSAAFSYKGKLYPMDVIRYEILNGVRMADVASARGIPKTTAGHIHQAGRAAFADWDSVCATGKARRDGAGDSGVAAAAGATSDVSE
jgi:hypothetical protein